MSFIGGRESGEVKSKNIGTGVILILLGIFWMAENLGFITWSLWDGIHDLWPLILVVVGLNVIFKKNSFIPMVTWILFFVILIGYGFLQGQSVERLKHINGGNVQIAKETGVDRGTLELDLGAGNIDIGNTRGLLVDANVSNPYIRNEVKEQDGGKLVHVLFKEKSKGFMIVRKNRDYYFGLNENVTWDLDIDMGAANGVFNLRELNVGDIDIDAGAADFELIFGEKIENTNVKIDTGASNVSITIPKSVGAKVKLDGAFKGSNLGELGWSYQEGRHQSPNYEEASKKINVDMDMGAGNLAIHVEP